MIFRWLASILATLVLLCAGPASSQRILPLVCPGIGGVCAGSAGTGIYSGFTLSWGDSFNKLSIVGPGNPNGSYFGTRGYGFSTGPAVDFRALSSSVFVFSDSLTTGYNDANRGVPVYSNVRVANNVMTLQTRRATTAESNASPNPSNNLNLIAQLSSEGSIGFYPTATCPVIVESRIRFNDAIVPGWYAAFWTQGYAPTVYNNANELDIFETDQGGLGTAASNQHGWVARVSTITNNAWVNWGTYDRNFHVYSTLYAGTSGFTAYKDGTSSGTLAVDTTSQARPQYLLFDSTADAGSFTQATWTASGTTATSGSSTDVNWARVWRTTGCKHFAPLANVGTLQTEGTNNYGIALAYNGTGSITFPSQAALWGSTPDNEYVECRPFEPNEPGTSLTVSYQQFPSYVTYNSGTRVVSIDFSPNTGNSGVLHCMVYAWNNAGGTYVPARFNIYRAPNITQGTLNANLSAPFSQDIYFGCDVGIVTPKTMAINSGLPGWATFTVGSNPTSFTISGTPNASGTSTLNIGCTNNNGQTTTANVSLVVSSNISRVWQANRTDTSNTTPITYNAGGDPPIGVAGSGRVVAVAAGCRIGGTGISSMTIGGVSATQVTGATVAIASGENAGLWYASVPTGTTATVVVTWQAACARSSISVWSIFTTTPAPSASEKNTITAFASGSSLSLGAITVPSGGAAVAFVFGRDSTSACTNPCISSDTWTNATSDYFTNGSAMAGSSASGADVTGTGSVTPSVVLAGANLVTAGSVGEAIGLAVAWGP